ncbi:MAG: cohesin domain-containing protein [bacterium]
MKKFFTLISIFFFTSVLVVHAAVISIAPSSKSVVEGTTFSVSVEVNTKGQAVNAAETTVSFPSDLLEVVSVAGAKTFSLQTPGSPSRTENSVSFSAGIPSPGYNGPRGGVGRITFKAKTPGSARITVTSGKVLLNDGNATDVFDGTTNALITITAAPKKEVPVEVVPAPETPATVTPTETLPPITPTVAPVVQTAPTQTISIKVSDLFTLIYVLIGIIVLLAISVLILVLLLLKKNKKIK